MVIIVCHLEPLELIGEGYYNLDALTEIDVTESFRGLPQESKQCQEGESFFNCTTRQYIEKVLEKCGCFPLHFRLSDQV